MRKINLQTGSDEDYQRVLVEMFYRKVYNTALFIAQDRHLAQDIAQETFIKAFKNLDTLREKDKFEAWLGKIASRTAIDYLRERKKWYDFIAEEEYIDFKRKDHFGDSPIERILEHNLKKEIIQQEILKLNPTDRQIFALKYEYGLKYEEISSEMEMTIEAIKSRLYRIRMKLKVALVSILGVEEGMNG